jgi:hypothetical protein
MKRTSRLVTVATVTTLFAGGALAGTIHSSSAPTDSAGDKVTTAVQEQSIKGHSTTKPFSQYSWERGAILDLMQEKGMDDEGTTTPVMRHSWERGEMLKLLHEKGIGQSGADATAASPQVVIYFDSTASEPGLPWDLGNTHAGRSIMLKYLEQARKNAPSL